MGAEVSNQVSGLFGHEGDPVAGVFSIKRITFANEDAGYAVVYLVPADEPVAAGVVAVGYFGKPRVGECYRIEGVWRRDPKYGMQVQVSSAAPEMPRSLAAIERYLAGSSIKGLGPHYAKALVNHFGQDTFRVLQEGGHRLEEAPGIGPVRARTIRESWAEHQGVHELMINLQGVAELTPNQAQRIYRQYGRESWLAITQDPYRLAEEVRGFGFKTCDKIAQRLGIAPDAPQRLQAAVVYLLKEALADGHLWSSADQIADEAARLTETSVEAIRPQIEALVEQARIIREPVGGAPPEQPDEQPPQALYLPQVAHTEQRIAERLAYYLGKPPRSGLRLSQEDARQLVAEAGHTRLTDEQRAAVVHLLTGTRLTILTGGPGTGKTTTMRSLIACLEALDVSYALCATTGRASKQLATSTQRPAATVHRHLGIGFSSTEIEPINETVLIVDESSMIDLWLLDEIIARMAEGTHLYLVGDVDQLPSVGPGAVLQDLIAAAESGRVPGMAVTRLTQIFRQEAGDESMIVVNCHRVRTGQRPIRATSERSDYFEMLRETPEEAKELAVSLVTTRLPQYLDVPPAEVQLLAPMHHGAAGIRALNDALQQALNPPDAHKVELEFRGTRNPEERRVLREGDKVRQTRNNYQKQVLNGDLGIISRINLEDKTLTVRFDDHSVLYTFEELDELVHSWAMTVHSAQGSQWPAVVVLMLKSHYVMLERNILYTALSRAERLAVLVTQEQAVRVAVAQARSTQRRTGLIARLEAALAEGSSPRPAPAHTGRLL
ncbi:MAG: ATP-dependent RecD-like DNA helicase [Chloroflexi bacterium]|jgi:exodeoxyribonuclease V alpha subunit|nr:ATP-dependent RecD-like DNA helicase [Chloroflexota bacterium]